MLCRRDKPSSAGLIVTFLFVIEARTRAWSATPSEQVLASTTHSSRGKRSLKDVRSLGAAFAGSVEDWPQASEVDAQLRIMPTLKLTLDGLQAISQAMGNN